MNLDDRLRAAAPIADDRLPALDARIEADDLTPRARWRPPVLRPVSALLSVAVLAMTVVLLRPGGDDTAHRAWAAEAVRVAQSVPRLLVGLDGWKVTRADEFTVDVGEMTFEGPAFGADLHWRGDDLSSWVKDRSHSTTRHPDVELFATRAKVFEYAPGDYTALWKMDGQVMEFRSHGAASLAEYEAALRALHTVSVDEWLGAMPPSVVLPSDSKAEIRKMLAGMPLPNGFQPDALADDSVRDHYQLGAKVAGAYICAWAAQRSAARARGDRAAVAQADAALQRIHDWKLLREMDAEGDYPEVARMMVDGLAKQTPQDLKGALGC